MLLVERENTESALFSFRKEEPDRISTADCAALCDSVNLPILPGVRRPLKVRVRRYGWYLVSSTPELEGVS